jgi:xanthine/CO dehydrogenase XdhC/CoxF family maturation factor
MKELQSIVHAILAPETSGAVLATLVSLAGSSYRRPGARLLVTADGQRLGSISGGCLEEDVMARAVRVAETGVPDVVVYDTSSENDLVWGVGLGCHGVVRVLLEKLPTHPEWADRLARNTAGRRPTRLLVRHGGADRTLWGTRLAAESEKESDDDVFLQIIAPPPALAIFGAGDDAMPLLRFANDLGWHVTVADPRASMATATRFPQADARTVGPAEQLVARVYGPGPAPAPPVHRSLGEGGGGVEGLAVVMTHHYVHDVPLLRDLLPRPLAYLGLLGPKIRTEKILADLAAGGFAITPEMRERLHAPVGLDLGADTPEQVALAIVAEMLAVLAHREARPLRERTQPIHEVFAPQKPRAAKT